MFFSAVGTRRVQEIVKPLLEEGNTRIVSGITLSLGQEVSRDHSRRLDDGYRYLVLDGTTLKVEVTTGVKKCLLLCPSREGWYHL